MENQVQKRQKLASPIQDTDGPVSIAISTEDEGAQHSSQPTMNGKTEQSDPQPRKHEPSKSSISDHQFLKPHFTSDASIVLVGIRGCGKRSLGFIAATALGRRFITEDHYFKSVTGLSRQDYLKLHGSEEFHKHDVEISRQMLEDNKSGCVIDCGLGSLTSALQDYLKVYSQTNPVIHIVRDMSQIKRLLKLSDRSAKLLENGDPTHRRCSNYEYFNLEDKTAESLSDQDGLDRGSPSYSFKLREAQADFSHFVKLVAGLIGRNVEQSAAFSLEQPVYSQPYTHALQIPFSAYEDGMIELSALESGGDIVEVMVDRWRSGAVKNLSRLVADIRRQLKIPVSVSIARKAPGFTAETHSIISKHGLRLAVDFLDIDLEVSPRSAAELVSTRGPTRFIASKMLQSSSNAGSPWIDGSAKNAIEKLEGHRFDLVKFLYVPKSRQDNDDVSHYHRIMDRDLNSVPILIAYNVGLLGRTSQVFNKHLTSVTHEKLRNLKQPNFELTAQITARESMQALFSSFVLDPLSFCIIGGNVTASLSPAMHNAAYDLLGLKHNYTTRNIKSWEDIGKLAGDPNFGGASIVQPWKVKLVSKVAHLSKHARIIGAINTLIPLRSNLDGSLPPLERQAAQRNKSGKIIAWYGDNTDWIAMSGCISRGLSPRNVIQAKSTALVIGAGGMARSAVYALVKLGCKNIFVYNRTVKNAEILADHYSSWFSSMEQLPGSPSPQVRLLRGQDDPWPADYSLPSMIISCVTHEHLEGNPDSDFTMPEGWLASEFGGVVLELAYMTRETPLIRQIRRHREKTGIPWVLVDGIETLFEQALAQFQIMTGRPAPPRHMREALNREIQKRQTFVADGEEFEVV